MVAILVTIWRRSRPRATHMADEPTYDVAISFLACDEPLALRVHSRLVGDGLSVFVFSKAQEKIAGGDGTEEFRRAFRLESKIVVVIYRDGWGHTPWTHVEQDAIQERALKGGAGWDFLLFVTIDRAAPPPWLPDVRIRLNFDEYGFEQVIGAIKNRAERAGARFQPIDATTRARLDADEAAFLTRRRNFFDSMEGAKEQQRQVQAVFRHVETVSREIQSAFGHPIETRSNDRQCVLRGHGVSVSVTSELQYMNRAEDGRLVLREHEGHVLAPGENGWYLNGEPSTLGESTFKPEVAQDFSWRWLDGEKALTSDQLADVVIQRMLGLLKRARAGDLPRLRY